jgi:hypothetical protein
MDANASIHQANAVASAYAQSVPAKAPNKPATIHAAPTSRSEDRYEPSFERVFGGFDASVPGSKSNLSTRPKNTLDRVELSSTSQDLKPEGGAQPPTDTRSAPKPEDPDEASKWSQDRLARLDHLALLVKEGHYRIEPFMVDEIALRLARAMASI